MLKLRLLYRVNFQYYLNNTLPISSSQTKNQLRWQPTNAVVLVLVAVNVMRSLSKVNTHLLYLNKHLYLLLWVSTGSLTY